MGVYDAASKRVSSGSDTYIKLQPGQKARVRVLDYPYVSMRQFKPGDEIATRFSWPVWDYEADKVKILEQGPMVFGLIADIVAEYGEDLPMECDLVIGRTGEALNTRYSVIPTKPQSQLPKEALSQIPVMADIVKGGVPLKDFGAGKKPAVQGPDGDSEYKPEEVPIEAYDEEL